MLGSYFDIDTNIQIYCEYTNQCDTQLKEIRLIHTHNYNNINMYETSS